MNRKNKINSGRTHLSLQFLLYLRLALYSVLEAMSQGTALGYNDKSTPGKKSSDE